jgi:RimJ/RimL family protein N-acetyltransferase
MEQKRGIPNDIAIRPVEADEIDAFRSLRLEALHSSPEAFGEDYEQALERPYQAWEEQVRQSQGDGERVIFVAVQEGELVGMAGVTRSTFRKTQHSASIWGVYVRPEQRGQGIGQALVEACVAWARDKRIGILKLGVITANPSAIRCYQRCGFSAYGVEPKAFYIDGVYYDLMRMTNVT